MGKQNSIRLVLAVLAVLAPSCQRQGHNGQMGRTYSRGRLSITVPDGWKRKQGELAFRTGTGTQHLRFIAVVEEPVRQGLTVQKQAELLEVSILGLTGISKIAESSTRIDGKQAHVIEFRRARAGSVSPLRGEHITVPLKDSVVTIFWYVNESDWQEGRREMERIVETIKIR